MKNLLKLNIKHKLTFTFLLLELSLIIIFVLVVGEYTKNSITNMSIQENQKLLIKGSQVITGYLERINKASLIFYETRKDTSPLWVDLKKKNDIKDEDQIVQALNQTYDTVEGIFQVGLMATNRNIAYLYKNHILSKGKLQTEYIDMNNGGFTSSVYVESTHLSHSYGVEHFFKNQKKVISYNRYIYEIPQNNLLGLLSVDIEYNYLAELAYDLYDEVNEELYIINLEDNHLIYTTDSQHDFKEPFDEQWFQMVIEEKKNGSNTVKWKEEDILVFNEINTDYFQWIVIKKIPESYLLSDLNQLLRVITYIGIGMLLVTLLVSIIVSSHFSKPIFDLLSKMEQIKDGHIETKIVSNRSDEYGELYRQFDQMMHTINELIINKYKLEIENKSIELKALQAQINPHFISNTLQLIGTEALMADDIDVYYLIIKLNNILNYSMKTSEHIVTVEDEVEYLSGYLDFQKSRFQDDYSFAINVAEDTKSIMLPKMTLQPIIENSFFHAFNDMDRIKKLTIDIILIEDMMQIIIRDNGVGISKLDIHRINSWFKSSSPIDTDYSSIGLKNVYSRLFFCFNKDLEMRINNNKDQGIQVVIQIKNAKKYKRGN